MLIFSEGLAQGLNDATLTAEKDIQSFLLWLEINFFLSLHYNGANSYLFVNAA